MGFFKPERGVGQTLAGFGAALPPSGRLLALDIGAKRVGVAVSDSARRVALVKPPLPRVWAELGAGLRALHAAQPVVGVVVGAPQHLDGTAAAQAQGVSDVAALIGQTLGVPVLLWDERLTSKAAEAAFFEQRTARGTMKGRKKASVGQMDSPAAALLLAACLEALGEHE